MHVHVHVRVHVRVCVQVRVQVRVRVQVHVQVHVQVRVQVRACMHTVHSTRPHSTHSTPTPTPKPRLPPASTRSPHASHLPSDRHCRLRRTIVETSDFSAAIIQETSAACSRSFVCVL